MKINTNNQMVLSENDIIQAWLRDRKVSRAVVADPAPVHIYNEWCFAQDIDATIQAEEPDESNEFVENCTSIDGWNMPDEYKSVDIAQYCLNKCETEAQRQRVISELSEFDIRGMMPVLKFLNYLVDTCKQNNIVLGVGRGSSVASYVLYLMGVHKIDSLKYELDIKEFLK